MALSPMHSRWRQIYQNRMIRWFVRLGITVLVCALLVGHKIHINQESISIWTALQTRLSTLNGRQMLPYLLLALVTKSLGIACAMTRWHLLLGVQGQKTRWHTIAATFLAGRFLGTFLPGTLGLDAYKAYEATKKSGDIAAAVAATWVEKCMGLCAMAALFVLFAPLGYAIFGPHAKIVLTLSLPIASLGIIGLLCALFYPKMVQVVGSPLARWMPASSRRAINTFLLALQKYQGRASVVGQALFLSLVVHASTAWIYVLTAWAVQAPHVDPSEVMLASTLQIIATVLSPLTIAGEGVREAVQALFLAERIGLSNSVLSAALGFWVAEAPTLAGGIIWWRRMGRQKISGVESQTHHSHLNDASDPE